MCKEMSEAEIRDWVQDNKSLVIDAIFHPEEIDHIVMCLKHIVEWYWNKYPLGSFLSAVVCNNFREACLRADEVNQKALVLYALFMYNKLPCDYLEKALGKKKHEPV